MKTEVYSWRVSPELKQQLEEAARRESKSLSALLDDAARQWLAQHSPSPEEDAAEQARIHREAAKYIGSIRSGRRDGSTRVRELVRESLRKKLARSRPH